MGGCVARQQVTSPSTRKLSRYESKDRLRALGLGRNISLQQTCLCKVTPVILHGHVSLERGLDLRLVAVLLYSRQGSIQGLKETLLSWELQGASRS